MKFVSSPNIPSGEVKVVLLSRKAGNEICSQLSLLHIKALLLDPHPELHDAIACHPDIMLHHLGYDRIVYAPGVNQVVLDELELLGFKLIRGACELGKCFPSDIPYNVARVGKFAFHNTKYTDPVLRKELFKNDVELVHVNQGYTKCAVCIVSEDAIITEDKTIASAVEKKGIHCLLIKPQKDIVLPGMSHGFLGGCTGLFRSDLLAISGNIKMLMDFQGIEEFIKSRSIALISLAKHPVIDIGSMLPLFYS